MRVLGWIVVILLLLFGVVGIFYAGWSFIKIAKAVYVGAQQLEPAIFVPLTVTLITATLGLAAALYTQYKSRKREIESAHRERKISIYLEFLQIFEKMLISSNRELGGAEIDANEMALKLLQIRTKAVLWASPGVIKALSQISNPENENNPRAVMKVLDTLQREMRKDIGLSNSFLEQDFFIKLYLTDGQEYKKLMAGNT